MVLPTYLPICFWSVSSSRWAERKSRAISFSNKRVAGAFELADLRGTQLDAGVLLVMQLLAALVDALILEAGGVVAQEALDVGSGA